MRSFMKASTYQTFRSVIYRKRFRLAKQYCKAHRVPDISEEEKKEIDKYWKNFGIKIRDFSWFRMYYYITGLHDPRFVPDDIAGLVVYPYYNNDKYKFAWRDKCYFDRLLPDVPMPETVCKRIRGRLFYDNRYHTESESEDCLARYLLDYCRKNACSLVVKPSKDTGLGKNVKKYAITLKEEAEELIKDWKSVKDFIVQRCIQQCPAMAFFNEDSTNMIRVYSWRHDDRVEILSATVRAGIPGHVTDVAFVDGIETVHLVGILPDGTVKNEMLNQDARLIWKWDDHFKLPSWEKIVSIVKTNHLYADNFDIIGWDFTIDNAEEPMCFEWNIVWPGTVFYQYTNGPFFGEYTDDVLAFLKEKEGQKKYLPFYMRAH